MTTKEKQHYSVQIRQERKRARSCTPPLQEVKKSNKSDDECVKSVRQVKKLLKIMKKRSNWKKKLIAKEVVK